MPEQDLGPRVLSEFLGNSCHLILVQGHLRSCLLIVLNHDCTLESPRSFKNFFCDTQPDRFVQTLQSRPGPSVSFSRFSDDWDLLRAENHCLSLYLLLACGHDIQSGDSAMFDEEMR